MSVITVNEENFRSEVLGSSRPVLIDFWASWCGPCRMLSPLVDEVAEEQEKVKVCKINVDDNPALAQQFGVSSIPMLAVVKDGKVVKTSVGAVPKVKILELIK